MVIIKTGEKLTQFILQQKSLGKKIGFVPTMGALHKGHLSLVDTCRNECDLAVCSIFVNPTQFNNAEDLHNYPVTIERDIEMLVAHDCDVLFLPDREEMYPANGKLETYNLGNLEHVLEGSFRPGHFQGVCQAVDRLLHRTQPDVLYLGRKDFQQCIVIEKLLQLTGRTNIALRKLDTIREDTGLAMSSRNLRLGIADLEQAPSLYRVLHHIKAHYRFDKRHELLHEAKEQLKQAGFDVEYVELVNEKTLVPVRNDAETKVVVAAAWLGGIRLIDNVQL